MSKTLVAAACFDANHREFAALLHLRALTSIAQSVFLMASPMLKAAVKCMMARAVLSSPSAELVVPLARCRQGIALVLIASERQCIPTGRVS